MFISQLYSTYTTEDHNTWTLLFQRQKKIVRDFIPAGFLRGFDLLDLNPERIPDLTQLSEKLKGISGWSLQPVNGLVSNEEFLTLLVNKTFPITVSIRSPQEIEFSELPDIFHDVYGHVPMLMDKVFSDFMHEYSQLAIKYIHEPDLVKLLGRFYWFTLETGLIGEQDNIKPYGAAILTSSEEIKNIHKEDIKKHAFNLEKLLYTQYNNLELQKEYFVIRSFSDLSAHLKAVPAILEKVRIS
jgi:phenylalanine-4-hydroxylase